MGLVRFLLAFAVAASHAHLPFQVLVPGPWAVGIFYLISGFYMTLILCTKYPDTRKGNRDFYFNRFLRIYPAYWLALGWALVLLYLGNQYQVWSNFSWGALSFLALSNIAIFGQEVAMFLHAGADGLKFTSNFWMDASPAAFFLLIPQGWTLAIELGFYLVAPFLMRRRLRTLLLLIGASFAVRLALWQYGYRADPWSYRFWPSELAWFLAGGVAYRLGVYKKKLKLSALSGLGSLIGCVSLLFFYPWIRQLCFQYFGVPVEASNGDSYGEWAIRGTYYAIFLVCLPGLFMRSSSRIDEFLGRLSYPVYVFHFAVATTLGLLPGPRMGSGEFAVLMMALTLVVSILFVRWLDPLFERAKRTPARPKKQRLRRFATT